MQLNRLSTLKLASKLTLLVLNSALYVTLAFANGVDGVPPTVEDNSGICNQQMTAAVPLEERQQSADEHLYTVEKNPQTGTAVRFYKGGRIPEKAVARVLLLHGFGAFSSQATSMNEYLKFFTNPDLDLKPSSTTKRLQVKEAEVFGESTSRRIGMEALDQPGTPNGAKLEDYKTIDQVVDQIIVPHIRFMKTQTPNLPILVLTRSGSSIFAENLSRRYPDLIAGLILTSPTMPDEVLNEKAKQHLVWEEQQGIIRVNWPSLNWILSMFRQVDFNDQSFKQSKTLILNGDTDAETDDIERRFYANLAVLHPNIKHQNIEFAGHDVVRVKKGGYNERKVEQTLYTMLEHIARVVGAN